MYKVDITGYVIYNEDTKMFSGGGTGHSVSSKTPKIYKKLGHVKTHLLQHLDKKYHYTLDYRLKEIELIVLPAYATGNWNVYEINKDNPPVLDVNQFFKDEIEKRRMKYINTYKYDPSAIKVTY